MADYEAKIVPELADAAEGRYAGQSGQGAGQHGEGGHGHGGRGGQQDQAGASQSDQPQGGRGRTPQRPIPS